MKLLFGRALGQRDDFDVEADAAEALGLGSWQVDLQALLDGNEALALATLPDEPSTFLYRGWMLTSAEYSSLEATLGERGHQLVVSADDYESCHHVPRWYPLVRGYTARTVWTDDFDVAEAWELAKALGAPPFIVKDYVKSAKERWDDACFVPPGATFERFSAICERLVEHRGDRAEGGFVVRRFLDLQTFGRTPTGPAFVEFRLFFSGKTLLAAEPYFDFDLEVPDFSAFSRLAARFSSPFFTMDVAQLRSGDWAVVEVNDGGVSALPASLDPRQLFRRLARALGDQP